MKTLPNRLRLTDGELVLADGGDVRAYLRDWALRLEVGPNTPVSLLASERLEEILSNLDTPYTPAS